MTQETTVKEGGVIKKTFRFTLDLEVSINKMLPQCYCFKGKVNSIRMVNRLLKLLNEHPESLLEIYKCWLIDDIGQNNHSQTIKKKLDIKCTYDVLLDLIHQSTPEMIKHFIGEKKRNDKYLIDSDFEHIIYQLSLFTIKDASFTEIIR